MSNARANNRATRQGFGGLGLALIVLLGWAADQTSRPGHHPLRLGQRWLGIATIALVTIVGRIVDALPLDPVLAVHGTSAGAPLNLARPPRVRAENSSTSLLVPTQVLTRSPGRVVHSEFLATLDREPRLADRRDWRP